MGFLNPALLWLAALAVPLVVLYILKVRRHDREVPTTWLWQEALRETRAEVPFRRLRRDWLLVLQLLALALLVLAAAGPYRDTLLAPGGQAALVLDASASMQAREDDTTRWEEARAAALDLLAGLGPGDRGLVLRAGTRPRVLAPLTDDRRALADAVRSARPSSAPADLDAALRLARRILGEEGQIVLVTDASQPVPDLPGLRIHRVGDDRPNTGIVTLALRPSDPSGASHEVFARVRNASADAVSGTLRILHQDRLVDASRLTLPPEGEAGRTLRLEGVRRGRIEIAWETEADDALGEDDRAGWILRAPEPRRYRFVGDADPWIARALETDPDWAPAGGGHPAQVEIQTRGRPRPQGPPLLWVDPAPLRVQASPGGEPAFADGAVVLDQDRSHPVLRYIDLHPVRLARVPRLERPPGARVLAESSAGPLLMEGSVLADREGTAARPWIAWGFEPALTDLPLRPSFPILVRNTLEFLAPDSGGLPGGLPAGSSPEIPWPHEEEARLLSPSLEEIRLPASGGRIRLPPLEELGLWRLTGPGFERDLHVSLLSERETDLRARSATTGPAAGTDGLDLEPGGESRLSLQGLWQPLILAVLALLLLEATAYFRRWTP